MSFHLILLGNFKRHSFVLINLLLIEEEAVWVFLSCWMLCDSCTWEDISWGGGMDGIVGDGSVGPEILPYGKTIMTWILP